MGINGISGIKKEELDKAIFTLGGLAVEKASGVLNRDIAHVSSDNNNYSFDPSLLSKVQNRPGQLVNEKLV
ncbi:MAG: hypothetical protein LBD99_07000 [Candidatus Margulisbacteria bacterium]|jgi:hypothetical protein|nr:hypothetical protein [Candidatus Margulisiibacteriota bacterium]